LQVESLNVLAVSLSAILTVGKALRQATAARHDNLGLQTLFPEATLLLGDPRRSMQRAHRAQASLIFSRAKTREQISAMPKIDTEYLRLARLSSVHYFLANSASACLR
jgi:hypothetical protein